MIMILDQLTQARGVLTGCRTDSSTPVALFLTLLQMLSLKLRFCAFLSKMQACEDPPNLNMPSKAPFSMRSPSFTLFTIPDTSAIPISMTATLPILGLSALMTQTWRTEVMVRRGWEAMQLSARWKERLGLPAQQELPILQHLSITPLTGDLHLWQHQGFRKPWQTVPFSKASLKYFCCSRGRASAPNISAREYLWSLSQNLSCHWTFLLGMSKLGQCSELLRMVLVAAGSKGRASSLISRSNQECQLVKPKLGLEVSQMKSLQLTLSELSHPFSGSVVTNSREAGESKNLPQASQMGLRWVLTSSRAKKVLPKSVLSRSMTKAQKGTPMMSSSENLGAVLVMAANWSRSSSQVMLQEIPFLGFWRMVWLSSSWQYSMTMGGIWSSPPCRYILATGFSLMYCLKASTEGTRGLTSLLHSAANLACQSWILLYLPSRYLPLLAVLRSLRAFLMKSPRVRVLSSCIQRSIMIDQVDTALQQSITTIQRERILSVLKIEVPPNGEINAWRAREGREGRNWRVSGRGWGGYLGRG